MLCVTLSSQDFLLTSELWKKVKRPQPVAAEKGHTVFQDEIQYDLVIINFFVNETKTPHLNYFSNNPLKSVQLETFFDCNCTVRNSKKMRYLISFTLFDIRIICVHTHIILMTTWFDRLNTSHS